MSSILYIMTISKGVHDMEESFLDVITDSALNERFDKIILQDEKYIQLQEKIESLSGEYDSLTLLEMNKNLSLIKAC